MVADEVRQAGADLVAFLKDDKPAAHLLDFVSSYFPALSACPNGDDLVVTNARRETIFIRRDSLKGHRGWESRAGSSKFRTSEYSPLLNAGGGVAHDARGLIEHLAIFNNRN